MIKVEGFGITADTHGYTVGKPCVYTDKKTGAESEILTSPKYFGNMKSCLRYIRKQMQYEAVKNTDGGIDEAIQAINSADERFERMIAGVEKE